MRQCPDCGGEMWDNRAKKNSGDYSPNSPDFRCKDKDCNKAVWLDGKGKGGGNGRGRRGHQRRQQDEDYESPTIGDLPGDPAPRPQQQQSPMPSAEQRRAFLDRHAKCFQYVLDTYVPMIEKHNTKVAERALENHTDPDIVAIDLAGIAILTNHIQTGQERAR